MADHHAGYQAFLLRLYRVDDGEQPVWRLMLEEAGTQEQHFFRGISDLQAFLADLIREQDGSETGAS